MIRALMTSWTMCRSRLPTSLGFISVWWLLDTVVSSTSMLLDGSAIFHGFVSTLTLRVAQQ